MKFLLSILGVIIWGLPSQAQTITSAKSLLTVRGDVLKPRDWTLAQLQKAAPIESISTTLKGKPYTARGVRLWSLIQAATPRLDSKSKHSEARFVVLARGKDGYQVSFALPELLPDAGNKSAFLIWEVAGQPLSAKEGPLRLVVPGDKKPMRWVYNVVGLEIYDGRRLSSKPLNPPHPNEKAPK